MLRLIPAPISFLYATAYELIIIRIIVWYVKSIERAGRYSCEEESNFRLLPVCLQWQFNFLGFCLSVSPQLPTPPLKLLKLGGQGLSPLSALPPEAVRTYLDAVKYGGLSGIRIRTVTILSRLPPTYWAMRPLKLIYTNYLIQPSCFAVFLR